MKTDFDFTQALKCASKGIERQKRGRNGDGDCV